MPKIFSETPIEVSYDITLEDLKAKYNRYQHIIYTCKYCHEPEERVLDYIKDLTFLCKSCDKKQRLISTYGSIEEANKAILQKRKETNKAKFGVEYPLQNSICKEKAKATCKDHFGVEYSLKSEEVRAKGRDTLIKKYGVTNAAYIPEVHQSKLKYQIELDEDVFDDNIFFILGNPIKKLSEANNICGIYKITNTINNKVYIGSSRNIGNRWHSHRNSCLWEKLGNSLYKDFLEIGLSKFKFEVIEICSEPELLDREQFWQLKLHPEYNKKLAISDRLSNDITRQNAISGVYLLLNNITGDFYIGSSKNIFERKKQHFAESAIDIPYTNKKLYEDIRLYGKDNFTFEVLEESNNIKELEQQYIDYFCPTYNIGTAKTKVTSTSYHSNYYSENKDSITKYKKNYYNHICNYNGEEIPFRALANQFKKLGIPKPFSAARKYIIE